jgi:hypothetical protein
VSLQDYFSKRASVIVEPKQSFAVSTTEEPPVVDNTLPSPDASEDLGPPYVAGGVPYPRYPTDDVKFGLSILDWFAGHALQGLCANGTVINGQHPDAVTVQDLVADAYTIAGWMVDLRSNIPVQPTPPPPPKETAKESVPIAPPLPVKQEHLQTTVTVGQT